MPDEIIDFRNPDYTSHKKIRSAGICKVDFNYCEAFIYKCPKRTKIPSHTYSDVTG